MGNLFAQLNIRQKIIAFTGCILVVFLIVMGLIFDHLVVNQAKERLREHTAAEAKLLDDTLRDSLTFMGAGLKEIAAEYTIRQGGSLTVYPEQTPNENGVVPMQPELKEGFERNLWLRFGRFVAARSPWVTAVTYGMNDGGYVQYPAAAREPNYDPRRLYWYAEVMKNSDKLFIGSPFRSGDNRAFVGVYTVVRDYAENPAGVLGLQADLGVVLAAANADDDYLVLDGDGNIIVAPKHKDILFSPISEAKLGDLSLMRLDDDDLRRIVFRDEEKYAGIYTSPADGYKYIFLLDPGELTAATRNLRLTLLALILLCLGVTVWASRYLSALITDPFKGIETAAEAIGEGNLSAADTLAEHDDEVGRLSSAFQEMSGRLQEKLAPLKQNALQIEDSAAAISQTAEQSLAQLASVKEAAAQSEKSGQSQRQTVAEIAVTLRGLAENMQEIAEANRKMEQGLRQIEGELNAETAAETPSDSPKKSPVVAKIASLNKATEKTAGRIDEITGMAEQINLLALNAAVEAARYDRKEKSKFTAVAESIRKLAENSAKAAQNAAANLQELTSSIDELKKTQAADTSDNAEHQKKAQKAAAKNSQIADQIRKIISLLSGSTQNLKTVANSQKLLDDAVLQIEWANRKVSDAGEETKNQLQNHDNILKLLRENARNIEKNAQTIKTEIETFVLSRSGLDAVDSNTDI